MNRELLYLMNSSFTLLAKRNGTSTAFHIIRSEHSSSHLFSMFFFGGGRGAGWRMI